MKKIILILTAIIISVGLVFALTPEEEERLLIDSVVPEFSGRMPAASVAEWKAKEITISSAALRGEGKISVYLPPGYYSSGKKYPVVYFLHGMGDNNMTWLGGQQEMDRIATLMIEKNGIVPMILVAPSGEKGLWSNFTDKSVLYEDWVVKEVVNYVEKNYRTRKGKKNRVIMGVSMGGFGALKIGMRHTKLFGCVCAISPALPPPIMPVSYGTMLNKIYGSSENQGYYRANHPFWIAKNNPGKLKNIKFILKCGASDGLYGSVNNFADFMKAEGLDTEWQAYPNLGHDVYLFRKASVDGLRQISEYFVKGK